MSQELTTSVVAPAERAAFWTDMICATYVELECEPGSAKDFSGSIRTHGLPGLGLSVVRSRGQRVMRTPRTICAARDEYVIASLQTSGRSVISQDGRDALLSPGDLAIYDSTRPYTLRFDDDFSQIVLKLRTDSLRSLVRGVHDLTATTVSSGAGAGHLLVNVVNSLPCWADDFTPSTAAGVAEGVINLLAAGLSSLPACQRVEPTAMYAYHVERIRRRIEDRLRDPTLTIESIAADLHMSVGHLHRLFKSQPQSPSQYMWNERLERCSRELLEAARSRVSVSEIAFSWGFNDAAHFSRAFRARFGCSPRDWRAKAQMAPSSERSAVVA